MGWVQPTPPAHPAPHLDLSFSLSCSPIPLALTIPLATVVATTVVELPRPTPAALAAVYGRNSSAVQSSTPPFLQIPKGLFTLSSISIPLKKFQNQNCPVAGIWIVLTMQEKGAPKLKRSGVTTPKAGTHPLTGWWTALSRIHKWFVPSLVELTIYWRWLRSSLGRCHRRHHQGINLPWVTTHSQLVSSLGGVFSVSPLLPYFHLYIFA